MKRIRIGCMAVLATALAVTGCENMSQEEQQTAALVGLGALAVGAAVAAGQDDGRGDSVDRDGRTVRLQSQGGDLAVYRLPPNQRGANVVLVRQLSDAPCRQGRSWGYDRNEIWVDDGCRAEFRIGGGGGGGGDRDDVLVRVQSIDNELAVYRLPQSLRGADVRLERQLSSAECRRNRSWGYDRNEIWVDDGCRAEFRIIRS